MNIITQDIKWTPKDISAQLKDVGSNLKFNEFEIVSKEIFDYYEKLIGATSYHIALLNSVRKNQFWKIWKNQNN